jgi:hypothetical protein
MLTGSRLRKVIDGFNVLWGFPQVVAGIDGNYIRPYIVTIRDFHGLF